MKKYSKENNPAMLSGYQFMLGGLVMTALGLAMGGSINVGSTKGIAVVIYLAFVSAVAYSLWSILLKFIDQNYKALIKFVFYPYQLKI